MNGPLVTIVVPCYNQARFLPETLRSVVDQTYPHWECIVVNDGSPDSTGKVARAAMKHHADRTIRLVEQENRGLPEARNAGISQARGEWILPLDSDDLLHPSFLERALAALRDQPGSNLFSSLGKEFGAGSAELNPPQNPHRLLVENQFFYASLYARSLWQQAGGYDPSVWGAEDWNFWISCSGFGLRPACLAERLFFYRKHPGTSMFDRMLEDWPPIEAMTRTCHPARCTPERLLADHAIIAQAIPQTEERAARIRSRFPQLPRPHLWLGLMAEARGDFAGAEKSYETSASLTPADDWQPLFRLAILAQRTGGEQAARPRFEHFLRRHPGIRFPS